MARLSRTRTSRSALSMLPKSPTGIRGFDEITAGGLPRGRPTLLCGGPGCGKTLFAMEFLARGALVYGEPGVFVSFEERSDELAQNMKSLGIDLKELQARGLLAIDHVQVNRSDIEENGEYDLEGLFVRLGHAIDRVGAKRVVLDTVESLFSALSDSAILRAELRRLFGWLKDRGVTAVITGEKGEGTLTRQGLEEYVSDCVIVLDHRASGHISTRRLQVVKYRGSMHGTNEYPFLIEEHGISILPITSVGLAYTVSTERVSSGIKELDIMLSGGVYKGSTILVSGTAGTGKTSIAASFVRETGRAGGRSLYFAFEESAGQIVRNMRSIGLDLEPAIRSGRLRILSSRPQHHGLEMHLAVMHREVEDFHPTVVVVDPLTSLTMAGDSLDMSALVLRLVDFLRDQGITALFTSLSHGDTGLEPRELQLSSLMDTWLMVRDFELGGERNHGLYILKSRGMGHSNQIREFLITDDGIRLVAPYLGPEGVLTGSARAAQESRERQVEKHRRAEFERRRSEASRRRQTLAAQILSLQAELESLDREGEHSAAVEDDRNRESAALVARRRRADGNGSVKRGTRSTQKGAVR